jgi:hypothetical protein
MIVAESYEVKLVESQLAAIEDASERVWAVATDDTGNKGNLLKAALDLVGAINGARAALALLAAAKSEAESNVDVNFETESDDAYDAWIDGQYEAWLDGQYQRYESKNAYVPGSVKLEAADYLPF